MYRLPNEYGSNFEKIGATAFAACTIWLTAVKFSGPHAWDVRAKVATDAVIKVESILQNQERLLTGSCRIDLHTWSRVEYPLPHYVFC